VKLLIKQIEDNGLTVTHNNDRYLWVKAKDMIIMLDAYQLFGLEEDDLMIKIKQQFYMYNIKIDIYNPDNNKSDTPEDEKEGKPNPFLSDDEKKKRIRELLTNKYKLI